MQGTLIGNNRRSQLVLQLLTSHMSDISPSMRNNCSVVATSVRYFLPSEEGNFSCTIFSYNSLPSDWSLVFNALQYLRGRGLSDLSKNIPQKWHISILYKIQYFKDRFFAPQRGASPEAGYSRRACAQVCAHARHANIIYILLRQWRNHQTSIGVGQETDIQLAVIDICAQSRHIQYQYLWLYTR